MAIVRNIRSYLRLKKNSLEKSASEAYNLWATTYDEQPDNLMLHLDNEIFGQLLDEIDINGRMILDIGCGTGRHWQKILSRNPLQIAGFDVSEGMLSELKKKFPSAKTELVRDNVLSTIEDDSVHLIISTLTIAHIENVEEVFDTWKRVLKKNGDVLLTDFHPAILEQGGKRNFTKNNEQIVIKNFVHPLTKIKNIAAENGFELISFQERFIDARVRNYYHRQNALPAYEKFKGMPVIYGLHLKKI